jgi:hypothetical protein
MAEVAHWRTVRVRTNLFHPSPKYSYLSITVMVWLKSRGQTSPATPPGKRLAQGMVEQILVVLHTDHGSGPVLNPRGPPMRFRILTYVLDPKFSPILFAEPVPDYSRES